MEEFKNMDKLKDELFEAIDKICKDYESKNEPDTVPKFKVGDWVIGENRCLPKKPSLIRKFYEYSLMDYDDFEGATKQIAWKGYIRHATPDEIESHLRKICDEKYIGKKVKSLHDENYIQKVLQFWLYSFNEDKLWYEIDSEKHPTTNLLIYDQGKFAEIIPDKKKLPKTREEFEIFLDEYVYGEWNRDKFLDQYEIQ